MSPEKLPAALLPEEEKTIRGIERKNRLRPYKATALLLAASAMSLMSYEYAHDVSANKERIERNNISIGALANSSLDPRYDNRAIVLVDGFGSYDSNWLASSLGSEIQKELYDGKIWYLSYGNAPLSTDAIAEKIAIKASEEHVSHIAIVGESAGGVVTSKTIPALMDAPDLSVDLGIFVATPYNIDSLRNNKLLELRLADIARDIVPDIEYSTYAHGVIDLLNQVGTINDASSAYTALVTTNSRINNEFTPTNRLLYEQATIIRQADFPQMFAAIDDKPLEVQRPSFLTFSSSEYDPFLDDKKSSEQICKAAHAVVIRCSSHSIEGAVHARPDLSIDAYRQTLSSLKISTDVSIALNQASIEKEETVFNASDEEKE